MSKTNFVSFIFNDGWKCPNVMTKKSPESTKVELDKNSTFLI